MLYGLDEICLIPNRVSEVEHRGDINVLNNHNKLPLFAAPMSCIINDENYSKFEDNHINVIIPRSVAWDKRIELMKDGKWIAVGFKEANYIFESFDKDDTKMRICIDQANGHMQSLLTLCKNLKDKFGDTIRIMTGNIANPYTYKDYAAAGIDYIRLGIGGGNVCTTSVLTGMHYPMGSLIIKCKEEKQLVEKAISLGAKYRSVPKIVADGGFKKIDQIVKAIALGADYVMIGEIFAKSEEACGTEFFKDGNTLLRKDEAETRWDPSFIKMREYYGMSTEIAQRLVNASSYEPVENFKPKHSEGQIKFVPVSYSLNNWIYTFVHALRSSMSYAGSDNLDRYRGHVNYEIITSTAYNAYMK